MIKQEIQEAINNALKEGKQTELKVLRFIMSEIKYEEIAKQKELSNEEVIGVIQREIKKRREAIEFFKQGERNDLVEDEIKQIAVIEKYLPTQLSTEELNRIIDETLSSASDKENVGKLIGLVMDKVKGRADGSQVAQLVRQKISKHS